MVQLVPRLNKLESRPLDSQLCVHPVTMWPVQTVHHTPPYTVHTLQKTLYQLHGLHKQYTLPASWPWMHPAGHLAGLWITHTHARTHMHTHTHAHTHTHTHTHTQHTHTQRERERERNICICTRTYTHTHTHRETRTRTHTQRHAHAHTHTQAHMHTHTHAHTHTHTHTQQQQQMRVATTQEHTQSVETILHAQNLTLHVDPEG